MRNRIWAYFRRKLPEGQVLTRRLRALRWLLWPMDSLLLSLVRCRGWQPETDCWQIDGLSYSRSFFQEIENAHNRGVRIEIRHGYVHALPGEVFDPQVVPRLEAQVEYYRVRCIHLATSQASFRSPERDAVCHILSTGELPH